MIIALYCKDKNRVIYLYSMDILEYNTVTIKVPTSWEDITVELYETFYKIKPKNTRERVAYMAAVCQIDPDIIFKLPVDAFTYLVNATAFIFEDTNIEPSPFVEIGDVKYFVPVDTKITLGEWIDADEAQKADTAVLSNVLAIICRPVGEEYDCDLNDERAAMFAALPVSKVLGVLGFFLHTKQVLKTHTEAFMKIKELADQLPQNINSLQKLGGGTKSLWTLRGIKFWILIILLKNRLRKYSRTYNTIGTKSQPKKPKGN